MLAIGNYLVRNRLQMHHPQAKVISTKSRTLTFIFLSLAFSAAVAMSLDRIVLARFVRETHNGFLFPPNTEVHYRTSEFSFTAKINSLGFRDRHWDIRRDKSKLRVIAIGDSFTYGWGVDGASSWPKILESSLIRRGYIVEIANLGKPGASPATYADIAKKTIPALQPDLTVVALLQGEDLAQLVRSLELHARTSTHEPPIAGGNIIKQILYGLLPNSYEEVRKVLRGDKSFTKRTSIEDALRTQATRLLSTYGPEQTMRFEALDRTVKELFLDGQLNPGLIDAAVSAPDYFTYSFRSDEPVVRTALQEASKYLQEIKEEASKVGSAVLVISIPYGIYSSERDMKRQQRLGFKVFPEMITSSSPDDVIRSICDENGIAFFAVTNEFRSKAMAQPLFFEFDNHFNAQGQKVFADLLLPFFENCVLENLSSGVASTNCKRLIRAS